MKSALLFILRMTVVFIYSVAAGISSVLLGYLLLTWLENSVTMKRLQAYWSETPSPTTLDAEREAA